MAVSSVSPLRGPDPEFCLGNLRGRGWPRRLTRNQLTLLGFPTTRPPPPPPRDPSPQCLHFAEPKITSECSDSPAPRLPAAQKKPRL